MKRFFGSVALAVTILAGLGACAGTEESSGGPRLEPLTGGPYPALLVTQAQFEQEKDEKGKTRYVPGPAKLLMVRQTAEGWKSLTLEDPDSNVFHKAMPFDGGLLTIGGTQAMLKVWRFAEGAWTQQTHWNPTFGGKFDRLRDVERGDVDGDGREELVVATHDQGVIAVLHPDENWRVEEAAREPGIFVHEIEIGDVDGDGVAEFFATPSQPNKPDEEQAGEVRVYRHTDDGYSASVVDAPGDTHAKELLVTDVDGDGVPELYVAWEGAVAAGGRLARPVVVRQYTWRDGAYESLEVASVRDRQMRSLAAGDVNGDGKVDLVAGAMKSGLWLFEQAEDGWTRTTIDSSSSGYEQPVHVADLDGDGKLEIYVGSEDQQQLRQYVWDGREFRRTVVALLEKGDISWNITSGEF